MLNHNPILVCRAGWCRQPDDFEDFLKALKTTTPNILPIVWHEGPLPEQFLIQHQKNGRPIFGLGHSLGFAQLLETQFSFRGVISIQGFTAFCSSPNNHCEFGTPRRILERMREKLCAHPQQVINDFRSRAGIKNTAHSPCQTIAEKHLTELKNGIEQLIHLQIQLPKNTPILAIANEDDPIVSWNLSRACFKNQKHVSLKTRPNGHLHALHQSDATGCATLINEWIQQNQLQPTQLQQAQRP